MKRLSLITAFAVAACQQSPEAIPDTPTATPSAVATPSAASTVAPGKAESSYSDAGKQQAWIRRGEDAIRAKLRDPDSATFRNVKFYSGGGVPVACGEVNSNNGFGGKAGYERFLSAGTTLAVLESEMTTASEMSDVWDKFCR